ncbi:MAG: anthranilate synthase component I [Sandaracinus sp.]|nr:anthranilate synthase component I [Sandaracinus sp.]
MLPSLDDFRTLAAAGATVIPVQRQVVADALTPVVARQTLATAFPGERTFLLESVVGGEKWARYSFVGVGADTVVRAGGGRFELTQRGETAVETGVDPWARFGEVLAEWVPPAPEALASLQLPRFWGGAVGYLAYDAVRRFEPTVGEAPRDDEDELAFGLGATLLIFDALRQTVRVVVPARVREDGADAAYRDAEARIDSVVRALARPAPLAHLPMPSSDIEGELPPSSFTRPAFEAAVERCKEHIRAGDIFQVVLSQRFELDATGLDPFALYRAMRVVNPSPYMFFVELPGVTVSGASPETLVRVEDGVATVRPIAGTRRRGATDAEDEARAADLLADPKERAEHVMLVDLGRNDLGRISKPGTVRITDRMIVERFSHVIHLTSNVIGEIGDGRHALDVLRATFPAGTLSGAPKVRAMQIIDELEPVRRGLYGGAVGYVGFDGNADLAIAIRTATLADGKLALQAGAGIVEASDPAKEFEETVNKARAGLVAIEAARRAETDG